jgi:DNA-directed RNA polymerase specialized sigma24 family protein
VTPSLSLAFRRPRRPAGISGPASARPAGSLPDEHAGAADAGLLAAERHAALRAALAGLPPCGRQLSAMLTADPPVPYAEISARLGIAVGSIGPTRARYLDRLRRHRAIAALIAEADSMPRTAS